MTVDRHRIADPDRPARTPPKTLALLAAAKRAGPAISAVCDHIHCHDGVAGVRRILGVLALARKHGPAVVEQAANAALEFATPTAPSTASTSLIIDDLGMRKLPHTAAEDLLELISAADTSPIATSTAPPSASCGDCTTSASKSK